MIKFEKSIFINRPQQDVFDFYSNLENETQWRNLKSVKQTSEGPIGAGSTWRETGEFLGREFELDIEMISYDPPRQYIAKTISGPFPVEVSNSLEAHDGGTLITVSARAEIGGFFKLAEGLVKKQLESQMHSEYETLKQILEAVPEKTV
ncbi:MAG TPA: hypothetical protein DCX53_15440 [Anaerolineae bacterium]|nr:hypothetical protein [Anaerolineae bacterium]